MIETTNKPKSTRSTDLKGETIDINREFVRSIQMKHSSLESFNGVMLTHRMQIRIRIRLMIHV